MGNKIGYRKFKYSRKGHASNGLNLNTSMAFFVFNFLSLESSSTQKQTKLPAGFYPTTLINYKSAVYISVR